MTDLNKRSLFKLAAVSALTVTALAACGKKEEAAPAPAAPVIETSSSVYDEDIPF